MRGTRALVALALIGATLSSGCSALLSAEATPVPGAAATLTRSSRTPIPTPVRTASAVPVASPSRVAVAASPSPAATPAGRAVSEDEISSIQQQMERIVGSQDLPGLESLLLDHVSLSTAEGGQVLDSAETATWLRERSGPGMIVTQVDRGTQAVMLEVLTEGWPVQPPLTQGHVSFSLRRYDRTGRPDEDNGDWKIDVISAE